MNNKKRICPYCGAETFQRRTIRHTLVIDEMDGEIISNNHEDFHTCPKCGSSYCNSWIA